MGLVLALARNGLGNLAGEGGGLGILNEWDGRDADQFEEARDE
jgi:hypothetical protein